jgi:signal transduction histidine kinase
VGVYVFNNEDEPDKVVVEVRDTGIGIDKCYRNSLFKVPHPESIYEYRLKN